MHRERLPAESVRGGAKLCMQMYRFMFNACRRPAPVEDITATHPHSNTRVLVIRKNRFFTFDIGEPGSTRSTVEEIEECVLACIPCACGVGGAGRRGCCQAMGGACTH